MNVPSSIVSPRIFDSWGTARTEDRYDNVELADTEDRHLELPSKCTGKKPAGRSVFGFIYQDSVLENASTKTRNRNEESKGRKNAISRPAG
jgi:hypothetical protein